MAVRPFPATWQIGIGIAVGRHFGTDLEYSSGIRQQKAP
jgi:hypothetical protein